MKSLGKEILVSLQDLYFEHPAFADVKEPFGQRIQDSMDGLMPCCLMLLGTSRVGKTELMKAMARQFPSKRIDGRMNIPFLTVKVRTGSGVQALDEAVISALGPRTNLKSDGALRTYMYEQLGLAKVRVIWFDEVNHLVERGSNITPEKAADWFKELYDHDDLRIGIVMSGIPKSHKLIATNTQLPNRIRKPTYFMPYRYDVAVQRQAFADCVAIFQSEFEERGCTFEIDHNTMVRHCYAVSAGQIGILSDFFMELARLITSPCEITFELCEKASSAKILPCDGILKPFHQKEIQDHQLLTILSSALHKNELPLPVLEHQPLGEHDQVPQLSDLYAHIGGDSQ